MCNTCLFKKYRAPTSICLKLNTQPETLNTPNFGQVLQDFAPASTGKPLLILALTDGEARASTAFVGCLFGVDSLKVFSIGSGLVRQKLDMTIYHDEAACLI